MDQITKYWPYLGGVFGQQPERACFVIMHTVNILDNNKYTIGGMWHNIMNMLPSRQLVVSSLNCQTTDIFPALHNSVVCL